MSLRVIFRDRRYLLELYERLEARSPSATDDGGLEPRTLDEVLGAAIDLWGSRFPAEVHEHLVELGACPGCADNWLLDSCPECDPDELVPLSILHDTVRPPEMMS